MRLSNPASQRTMMHKHNRSAFTMFHVAREIHFCYGHRLLGHQGKCKHLHGHTAKAVITLRSEALDDLGMVIDFSEIKKRLQSWIDEHLDHKLLLSKDDPLLEILRAHGEPIYVMEGNPTAETIAKLIFDVCRREGLPVVEVKLWETHDCFATYLDR